MDHLSAPLFLFKDFWRNDGCFQRLLKIGALSRNKRYVVSYNFNDIDFKGFLYPLSEETRLFLSNTFLNFVV